MKILNELRFRWLFTRYVLNKKLPMAFLFHTGLYNDMKRILIEQGELNANELLPINERAIGEYKYALTKSRWESILGS